MKGVRRAVLTGAFALTAAVGAQAQSGAGSDLLRQIGRAIQGTPKVVNDRVRSPYLEPAGTYWDLDQEGLEGVQHLRAGVTAVGGGGVDTCDMQLLAMAHSAYRIEADKRQWCLRQWWLMDTKVHGANGVSGDDPAAIERRYGPAFDARLQRFKAIRRFAVRPTFQALGDVAYRADRGVLEGFIPMPQVSAAGQSVTGRGFVPWVHRTAGGVSSPPNAGRFHLLVRMDAQEAANLARQGRSYRDDLVVFSVNRVWVDGTVPKMDVTIEKVRLGYRDETIDVDLTHKQGAPT
ncbi:TPA: hypothetical protein ACOEBE_001204 [Stenotrophomonas maltophilia]|uniref:hypothetical protein n=1 Tax=Stenotrophomonas maltophilia TaxID=40324 RepID=UPI00066B9C7F|nr:hypothetical protein [Stenotrophomonas maltophilia]KUJ04670.1 hypothetical protein AR275_28685 [Stenotrophomonas maltophilia]MBH1560590.1 hypothetical protein [Stenotrophomonas maltophilia]MBN5116360.1 hypothetical protein [Stenotrophomonas maltophilia]MCU1209924.1 hypothetical protein [Stenotrophomonas maltophilia]HEL5613973.1 hypothetical protein [Stenotrophomonas maltophilia]